MCFLCKSRTVKICGKYKSTQNTDFEIENQITLLTASLGGLPWEIVYFGNKFSSCSVRTGLNLR